MKSASADGGNESGKKSWPRVLQIASSDEFQQSFAVAQLAVRLCELQKRELQNKWEAEDRKYAHDFQVAVTEPEKKRLSEERNKQIGSRMATLDTEGFLSRAWQLIEKAREHVLRPQTDAEYLTAHGGSHEAAVNVIARIRSATYVPFRKLCDPQRHAGGTTETIKLFDAEARKTIEVEWKVYRSERGFDDLFWDYWNDLGEQWLQWMKGEKPRPLWMKIDAVTFAKLAHNKEKYPGGFDEVWKRRGQSVLASWKKNGVPGHEFPALAKFRKEHDKRAANLKKKPTRKHRRLVAKVRA